MGAISAADLALLRQPTDTHRTVERLYAFGFPAVWAARVNDAGVQRGQQTIAYNNGALQPGFNFADIAPGMLVFFGSTAEADDRGRRLLLSISGTVTSGSIVVDWHDDVQLSDGDHITIVHAFPPWPRYSWFQSSPTDFRKDGPPASLGGAGVDYTDQNSQPPPHVVMGRHYAGQARADAELWWLAPTGGISPVNVVAAYQAIGAHSLADSYVNLANPGQYTLSPGVAPAWSAAGGWAFDGLSQYLDTGIVPASGWTILIRFSNPAITNDQRGLAGELDTNAAFGVGYEVGVLGDKKRYYYHGGQLAKTTAIPGHPSSLGVAGNTGYRDGAAEFGTIPAWTGTASHSVFIGAFNNGGAASLFFQGNVLAVVIYDVTLTAAQVATITAQMQALTASDAPFAIFCDASNSQAVAPGASLSSYAWSFTPGGVAGAFVDPTAPQTRFYPAKGQRYWLHCSVTDSNGKATTGHRAAIVDDPDESVVVTEFGRGPITEQFDRHDVRCSITITSPDTTAGGEMRPQVNWDDFRDETLLIITAEDHYGSPEVQKTISFRDDAIYTDRQHVAFCGYAILENRDLNSDGSGRVAITAVGAVEMFLYSLSITGVRAPADWYQMDYRLMSIAPLLFHLLHWHSTLLEISDWWLPWSDTVRRSAVEEWTEGGIMERARSLAGPHGRLMAITANAQGEIFVETDLNLRSQAERNSATTTMTLDAKDVGNVRARLQNRPSLSQVFVAGGSSDGVLGTFTPFLSISQYVRRAAGTGTLNLERLMLPDQTEANRLSGRIQTVANRRILEIELEFNGNYREIFSPAGQQWLDTGAALSGLKGNIRGDTDLENIRLVPRQVTKGFDGAAGQETVRVIFDAEAPEGLPGRTITLPAVQPRYVPPAVDTSPGVIDTPAPSDVLVTGDDANGVEVYDGAEGAWEARNDGLSGDALKVRDLVVVPYWWLFQDSSDPEDAMIWIATDGGLHFSDTFGRAWEERTPLSALDSAPGGVTPDTVAYVAVDTPALPQSINRVIVAACREQVAGVWHSWLLISENGGRTWTSVKRA